MDKCSVKDCNITPSIKGFCNKHYLQMYRHGKILVSRTISEYREVDGVGYVATSNGTPAKIDHEDYDKIKDNNYFCMNGYAYTSDTGKVPMHRIIMGEMGERIDHINHDTMDNRKCNLRICSVAQNRHNSKPNKNTSSKYKGVSFAKDRNLWRSRIRIKDVLYSLGQYEDEEDAAIAYNVAAQLFFGEFAYLNDV